MPQLKPKIRDGLVVSDFGDELVVCSPRPDGGSQVFHLNAPATIVFRLCDGTGTPAELAADIADFYGMPVEEVDRDVRSMVRLFRRSHLLTWKPVPRRRQHEHQHAHEHEHVHEHEHEHETGGTGDERQRIYRQVLASE